MSENNQILEPKIISNENMPQNNENFIELQNNLSVHSSEKIINRSYTCQDLQHLRKTSLSSPKIDENELLKIINDHQNKFYPEASKEVIDNIKLIKDYKWKLGMLLNDKINSLNSQIKEVKERIEKKKKEINETNIYENKINHLNDLIRKEENKDYQKEKIKNLELQKKKESLIKQIEQMEENKKNMRDTMIKKYKNMMELKQILTNSINDLLLIQQHIKSRTFAFEQAQTDVEPSVKLNPEEQNLLQVSQNIGEYINKNLLIKDNDNNS